MKNKKTYTEREKMDRNEDKAIFDKLMLRLLNNRALAAGWIDERTKRKIDRQIEMIAR